MARTHMDHHLQTKAMISTEVITRDHLTIQVHKVDRALNRLTAQASKATARPHLMANREGNRNTVAVVVNSMVKARPPEASHPTNPTRPTVHHHSKAVMVREDRSTLLLVNLTGSSRMKCTEVLVTEADRAMVALHRRDRLREAILAKDSTGAETMAMGRDTVVKARISMAVGSNMVVAAVGRVNPAGRVWC